MPVFPAEGCLMKREKVYATASGKKRYSVHLVCLLKKGLLNGAVLRSRSKKPRPHVTEGRSVSASRSKQVKAKKYCKPSPVMMASACEHYVQIGR